MMNALGWTLTGFSAITFIGQLIGIKNKRFSFIVRYILVGWLFWDLEIFSNEILNFFLLETISIGFIIYVLSYCIVPVVMIIIPSYKRSSWRIVYFIIYVVIAVLLWGIFKLLSKNGILPLPFI